MIDRPIKKSAATQDVRAPQMDQTMRRAVEQLHEIAQASASQRESDAKILSAAITSAQTLRDAWQIKANQWKRALWVCVCCGIMACGTIGLIAWNNSQQSRLHQVRLRHEIVELDDEINSLRTQVQIQTQESPQQIENTDTIIRMESLMSKNTLETHSRFNALTLSATNLAKKLTDFSRKQNSLLLAMIHRFDNLEAQYDTPHQTNINALAQRRAVSITESPTTIIAPLENVKATNPSVRLLRSTPIDSDDLTVFANESILHAWSLPDSFLNSSGSCIPSKLTSK